MSTGNLEPMNQDPTKAQIPAARSDQHNRFHRQTGVTLGKESNGIIYKTVTYMIMSFHAVACSRSLWYGQNLFLLAFCSNLPCFSTYMYVLNINDQFSRNRMWILE